MTILGQPLYYWAAAILAVLVIRAYVRATIRVHLYKARCQARAARAAEDFYWRSHGPADGQRAFRLLLERHTDRLNELLNENNERREQRLRVVS